MAFVIRSDKQTSQVITNIDEPGPGKYNIMDKKYIHLSPVPFNSTVPKDKINISLNPGPGNIHCLK